MECSAIIVNVDLGISMISSAIEWKPSRKTQTSYFFGLNCKKIKNNNWKLYM